MEEGKFDQAAKIKQEMNTLKMIQDRVENKQGHFKVAFGVAINEQQHFCPIVDEELNNILTGITKQYCEQKMAKLKDQFNAV
jgi:hypothetical protein